MSNIPNLKNNVLQALPTGSEITVKPTGDFYLPDGTTKLNLSIIYYGFLQILSTPIDGMIAELVPTNLMVGAGGGAAIYYVNQRLLSNNYDATGANKQYSKTRKETIVLDVAKEIRWNNVETLDLSGGFDNSLVKGDIKISSMLVNNLTYGAAVARTTYLYARVLQTATNAAKDTTKAQQITLTKLPATPTTDNYRNLWGEIIQPINLLANLITQEYAGINPDEGTLFVSPANYKNIILATSNLGSNISTERLINGEITYIGGYRIVKCPWLGEKYDAGKIDSTEAFDFSGVDMMWIHKEALAFAYTQGSANSYIDPTSQNPNFLDKFYVGKGMALRPDLVINYKFVI